MPRLVGHVSCLQTFPVKSCKGIKLNSAWCYYEGLEHDRRWAVVGDETGQCLSMKDYPKMCLVEPELQDDCLRLNAPDMEPLTIMLPLQAQEIKDVRVGKAGTSGKGQSAGPEAATWISKYLDTKCSIYQLTDPRYLKGHKYGALAKDHDKTGFASFAPVLLCTTEALNEVNKNTTEPFSMDRFRPTIIISDTTLYDEDNWKSLYIGDKSVQLRFLRRCGRCAMVRIDPDSAVKTQEEPFKILEKTRLPLPENRKREGYSPIFGVYFAVEKEGSIRVGDPVYECSE
ncbi:mitochondrial amidoxime reducing component 2 [Exaiptasia diaphana]|uniref:MOSC domain-containing protein n=1 Tax=Exaiptasia diaphana TaxID=2652724 RepID=A0A913XUI1_EXADI|nr:mitochondrial amidoxime reducing component 2 [Exaiptasia diaphana]KXJ24708.1 Mitochondrial amidoxime reducing component 2 [Exaiptasia diaphana]